MFKFPGERFPGLTIPPFEVRRGESIEIIDPLPYPKWDSQLWLLQILARRAQAQGINAVYTVGLRFDNPRVVDLLRTLGVSSKDMPPILHELHADSTRRYRTYGGSEKKLLEVYAALACGAEIVIWSVSGIDYMGMSRISKAILDAGAASIDITSPHRTNWSPIDPPATRTVTCIAEALAL